MSDEEKALVEDMLSMLRALHENKGWDELETTLEEVEERAAELGIK